MNVAGSSKIPPYLSVTSAEQLDRTAELGFNVIRLTFNWEAYEPLPGAFNEAYAQYLADISNAAWDRGLYSIVDVHQDVYSRYLAGGCGEGFPGWALSPSSTPHAPDNGPDCADWLVRGLTDPDMHRSFADFYANTTGARTAFLRMLRRIATRYGTLPGVIGYDILNEPWGSEPLQLSPLYADAIQAIRSADPSAIAFVEPHILVGQGIQTNLPKPGFNNFSYAPHFYDTHILDGTWAGDTSAMDTAFANMNARAQSWNAPLFVGEFGGPATAPLVGDYVRSIYGRLDLFLASGAQWNYTPLWSADTKDGWNGEDLSIVNDALELRPNYPIQPTVRAVSGTPLQIKASPDRLTLSLTWLHSASLGPTELFAPLDALYGGEAPIVETAGQALTCAYDDASRLLLCSSETSGLKKVVVRPKP